MGEDKVKIKKFEHMTDNQLIMCALLDILIDQYIPLKPEMQDELEKRINELRQNLPLEEHKKYYGGKDE